MIDFPELTRIVHKTPSRILMLVVDGLGGLPSPSTRRSELETARLPNLDRLAAASAAGLVTPVHPGITPGSGPAHLALFGYDPLKYMVGRGVLEALGCDIELRPGDVAARGNFCTLNGTGAVADRRAGRISTEQCAKLCARLHQATVSGVKVEVHPVADYRFVLVLRGEGLSDQVSDTDPSQENAPPLLAKALAPVAERTASVANGLVARATELLRDQEQANGITLRGFSSLDTLPSMAEAYRLNPAAIAAYPMYRGLARLIGMKVLLTGKSFASELDTLRKHSQEHDFIYLHYKPADTAGEDGNFEGKVAALEELDRFVPDLLASNPDVLVITGDHATPAVMASHSWHPVPLLIHSAITKGDGVPRFTERACAEGSLGRLPSVNVMLLALAHAGKLTKFGP